MNCGSSPRSEHTARAYKNALHVFRAVLIKNIENTRHITPIEKLTVWQIMAYLKSLPRLPPRNYICRL